MSCQFNFDEDQEMMVTEHTYLSSKKSENSTYCSSPNHQLPNNVPDSYDAVTQLIAFYWQQMSASGTKNVQNPPILPTSLVSDDDEDKLFASIVRNFSQNAPYVPNHCTQPIQLFQQFAPIPKTPESPNTGNRKQSDSFCTYHLPDTPATTICPLPSV